jgi:DNA modification methylase
MPLEEVIIGDCRLIRADWREVVETLGIVGAVVTDPPYGIRHTSHGQRFARATPIRGDADLMEADSLREWTRQHNLPLCMFFSPYRPMTGFRNVLCWNKGAHVGIGGDRETCWKRDFELIGIERNGTLSGQRDSAVISINAVSPPPSGHFAEKPVALMRYLIDKLDAPSILDPFMGSGSTLVAAQELGLPAIGIESDKHWFDVACRRIEEAYGKGTFFDDTKKPQADLFTSGVPS